MGNITVPEDFADWKLTNPSPREQIDYFNKHPKTQIPHKMWDEFYCVSLEHKGFHCGSCMSDEGYLGMPNFDDQCCCLSEQHQPKQNTNEENGKVDSL